MQGPSDHALLKYASQFLYRRLLEGRIEVLEYQKSFLHTKVAVVDQRWATVGSSNLDPFSLLLSREANVEIVDPGFARELVASLEAAMGDGAVAVTCDTLARLRWYSRFLQWASYRFSRAVLEWLSLAR